jgi:hypothetical protein
LGISIPIPLFSSRWREVELEKDGNWGPKFVFSIKSMSEIVSVDGDFTAGFLNY